MFYAKHGEHLRSIPLSAISENVTNLVSDAIETEVERTHNSVSWAMERFIHLRWIDYTRETL